MFALKRRFVHPACRLREMPDAVQVRPCLQAAGPGKFQKSFGQAIHQTFQSILQKHEERGAARQSDPSLPLWLPPVPAKLPCTLDEAFEIYDERWALNGRLVSDRRTYGRLEVQRPRCGKALMEGWEEAPISAAWKRRSNGGWGRSVSIPGAWTVSTVAQRALPDLRL